MTGRKALRQGLGKAFDLVFARERSTARRQPGILMHVHPVLPWNLKLQQPQLPRSEPDGQPTESSQLAPVGPTAWQRAQFLVSNNSPRPAGVVASCAKTGATTLIVIIVTRTCRHMANRVHRLHRESCRGAHSQRETSPRSGPRLFRLADAAIG